MEMKVARAGKTPGKTRGIYLYETREGHQYADLPGVGYARIPRSERESFGRLADALFESGRVALAIRLVDPRVPASPADAVLRDYLADRGAPALVVATKWDRLSAAERARARRELEREHGEFVPVSAKTGEGVDVLRREIRRRIEGGSGGRAPGSARSLRTLTKASQEEVHHG